MSRLRTPVHHCRWSDRAAAAGRPPGHPQRSAVIPRAARSARAGQHPARQQDGRGQPSDHLRTQHTA